LNKSEIRNLKEQIPGEIERITFPCPLIDSSTWTKKGIAIWSGFYRKEGAIREG